MWVKIFLLTQTHLKDFVGSRTCPCTNISNISGSLDLEVKVISVISQKLVPDFTAGLV